MTSHTTLPQNQGQIMDILTGNRDPNIKQAKFILPSGRTYTLEFDHNVQMKELKIMIQKAAHLRKNSFILLSEGINYTQHNEETFDSLFPDKQLVIFTMELIDSGDAQDETELLLQINTPCPDHTFKFLLYYCFDCGKSICSECFTNGIHKGHHIQDKCFYLLPSKYLVEKMFENWSQKPYEDFQISVNLNQYKTLLNQKLFAELIKILLQIQEKCNALIDKYNQINEKSLNNIRESVRDIKVFCIKALDEYKNAINIKDIINSEEMFIDFHNTYTELGIQQKEKFKENVQKFNELNKSISSLVQNLIDSICKQLSDTLTKVLNNKQYEEIEKEINLKLIKPLDKEQIMNQISDKKNKMKNKKYERYTLPSFNNSSQNVSKGHFDMKNNKNNKYSETAKARHTFGMEIHSSLNPNNSMDNIEYNDNKMDWSNNSYDNMNSIKDSNNTENNLASNGRSDRVNLFNDNNRNNVNSNINNNYNIYKNNYNIDSNKILPKENKIIQEKKVSNINDTQLLNPNISENNKKKLDILIQKSGPSYVQTKMEYPQTNINQGYDKKIYTNEPNDINSSNLSQTGANINIKVTKEQIPNAFSSVLNSKNKIDNKGNMDNNSNIFDMDSNQKVNNMINMNQMNEISPIPEYKGFNQNNSNQSNNSSFNQDINNLKTATFTGIVNVEISNPFDTNDVNKVQSKNKTGFDNNNNYNNNINKTTVISVNQNKNTSNFNLSSPFNNINQFMKGTNINKTNNVSNIGISNINNNVNKNTNDNINNVTLTTGIYPNTTQTNINYSAFNNSNDNTSSNNINHTQFTKINLKGEGHLNKNNNFGLASVMAEKIRTMQNQMDNEKYITMKNNNFKPIYEEAIESDTEIKQKSMNRKNIDIQYYLNKPFILCPIPETNKLKIATSNEDDENVIDITFPKDIGISYFLKDCAYCNYDKKLYITGGTIKGEKSNIPSKKLFVIDLFQTNLEGQNSIITELQPMTVPKIKHSMIGYKDKIYVIGGENSNVVESYDIKNNKWEQLNSMIRNRAHPNLFIYEDYLYAFFGKDNDDYAKSIERLNLANPQSSVWEMILFSNPNDVDLRIYGCGLYQNDDCIYFFGGKCMDQVTDDIFFINMKERTIESVDAKLKWKESFRENSLFQLGNHLVQISDEKYFGNYWKVVVE